MAAYCHTNVADIDPHRFWGWFDQLAEIGRTDTGWNRVAWTPLEAEARTWFTAAAEEIGLEVRRDGAGTLWAVTPDADEGPWVCAGSHLDTQPNGGAYDGALGVVSALEAAAALLDSGVKRRHPLAVVSFVDEEGARFRVACFASLAITGGLDIDHVLEAMGDAPQIYDVTAESLRAAPAQLARVRSMLEVHVEQGVSLVERDLAVGIATVLTPRQRWKVEFFGAANHAGTTMMPGRRDALVAAAPFVLEVDRVARAHPGAVGTVGKVEVVPGSTNSIPGHVTVSLDVRAPELATVEEMVDTLRDRFGEAHVLARGAQRRRDVRSRPARDALRGGAAARDRRRRPALVCGPRFGHPRAACACGDGVRPQPDRREPHAGGVRRAGGLRGRRAGADRRARGRADNQLTACG